ncbi:MAG TPA: Rieske 2Fe-2S domain-containing protein [Anaerolineales bacterium]|nr:Rieske 2Fe-2S domain-containing protein [Anaerolineales bacterium]
MTETSPSSLSRRDFLKLTWAFFGGVVAVETAGVFLAYLQPRLAEGEFGSVITAGLVDDFPANSVTHIPNGRFYIVRIGDGGFLAVYHRCTHLGCTVPWDATAQKFVCPCHNSQFDQQGTVENPPAPRPLDLFALTIENGEVKVDTGDIIQRQTYDMAQVIYP